MAQLEEKRIMFCQGDKRELEEITGQDFEYIIPPETYDKITEALWPGKLGPTFLVSYDTRKSHDEEISVDWLMYEMRDHAIGLGADAIIHYQAQMTPGHGLYTGYSMGTPVRRKSS